MAWEVPITVDGQTYTARFEGDAEPTASQIEFAKRQILDPARGQGLGEGMVAGLAQGFQKGMTATFLSGPGAIGEAFGADDNFLLQEGRAMEKQIEQDNPISIDNEQRFPVKATRAIGQAASMIATAPLGGTSLRTVGVLNHARRLAFMGGLQGASSGEEEATRLGITDPKKKAALILGYGTIEAFSEKIGGYGVETGLWRMVRGNAPQGRFIKRVLTQGAIEGGEEVGAGIPQRALSMAIATENPDMPGFTYEGQALYHPADVGLILEEFALGAVAGSTITSVQGIFSRMTPQQRLDTVNVSSLPEELRQRAYDALQRVSRDEAQAVGMAGRVDEGTASAMRVAFDGKRANVIDEANAATAAEYAPGYQEREKAKLIHSSDAADTFFEGGEWIVQTGTDENGQAIFSPAPNAAELEKARQEYIKTGTLGEGMQELKISAQPPSAAQPEAPPPAATTSQDRPTRHRVFEGGGPLRVAPGEGVLDARNPESAYRITGQPQIDDMVESGQVRAREGKMRGGRSGETQWSRGHERLGYPAKANKGMYVVVSPQQGLNDRQGGVPLSEVTQIFQSDGTTWNDVTEQVKQQAEQKKGAVQPQGQPPIAFDDESPQPTFIPQFEKTEQFARIKDQIEAITGERPPEDGGVPGWIVSSGKRTLARSGDYIYAPNGTVEYIGNRGNERLIFEMDTGNRIEQAKPDPQQQAAPTTLPADQGSSAPQTYKSQEIERVKKAYPQSPELVSGIENAIGDAGTKAFLDKAEPKAKLLEEVTGKNVGEVQEKMREEGVDEATINRQTTGGQFNPRSVTNAIMRSREMRPQPGSEPEHVKQAKEKMAQIPQERVDIITRGISQGLSTPQIAKTYDVPEEEIKTVLTALRVPTMRNESTRELTDDFLGWLATNYPQQHKKLMAERKAAKRKKQGPRTARASRSLDDVMRSREFREAVAGDFIDQLQERSGTRGFAGPRLIRTREGGKFGKLRLDPEQQGEWDWYGLLLEDPELREFIDTNFLTGGQTIADAGNAMGKMREQDVGEALVEAARARLALAKQIAEGRGVEAQQDEREEAQQQEEKQVLAWGKATEDGATQVTSWDLRPGDTLDVEGEPVTVRGIVLEYDESTGRALVETAEGQERMRLERAEVGDVILDDGARFGRQLLTTGEGIWVEKHNRSGQATEETTEETTEEEAPPPEIALPQVPPQTSRQQAAEFESRMREIVNDDDIDGVTNADIEAATKQHITGEAQEMSPAAAEVMARVQAEMRSPAEVRADNAEQAQEAKTEMAKAFHDMLMEDLRARGWNTDWPILPQDLAQPSVLEAVKSDPTLSEEERAKILSFAPGGANEIKFGVTPKATTPTMLEWANGVVAEGNVNAGLNARLLAAHSIRAAYWIMEHGNNFTKWSAQMIRTYGKAISEHLAAIWNLARATMYGEGEQLGPEDSGLPKKTGYENVPDALMGFSQTGPNKGFHDSNYPFTLDVEISVDDGKTWEPDKIKGMNEMHAIERAKRNWPDAMVRLPIPLAPERRVSPLTPEIVTNRGKINAYGEGLWEEAQAIQAEMAERGDNSIQFSRTAERYDHIADLVEGQPSYLMEDGTIVVVTDQVFVTLADTRNARKNDTTPPAEAIRRTIAEQRRAAGEQNVRREAREQARKVLRDIQSTPQFPVLVDALWESDAFMELDAIAGQRDNLTRVERTEAVEIWIDDHFTEQIASVLAGDASLGESMLPPGASRAARTVEQLIKDALTFPYLLPQARIRFSARDRGRFGQLQGRFAQSDAIAKQNRNDDAALVRQIDADAILEEVTDDGAREWGRRKLEHYARLIETGQLQNRHLTESFSIDYLPIYRRRASDNPEPYRQALKLVRAAVRKITGDNINKYGYHDSSREPTLRQGTQEDLAAELASEQADSAGRAVPNQRGTTADSSPPVARASAQDRPQNRGVSRGDVQSAINGLRGILPNVDNTWVGTRGELQDYLRHNARFRAAWMEDWKASNGNGTGITPEAAYDDFINFGLEGMEALTFDGRTFLMTDQIDIKPERGGTGPLSARWVLIHENTHEVVDHILDRFPELRMQWHALRNRVNPAQLDRLAETRWTWMRNWRNNTEIHDRLVHEWLAERISEIEERGQPAKGSLLGRLMQWLRDVFSAAMGAVQNLNPSDRALLDFIEAARASYQQVLNEAARKGVRYSASDHDGNTTPASATAPMNEGATPVQITPPPRRRPYNRWSERHRSEYESAQSNPNLPRDMFHFMQFLGEETNHERLTQSVAPMLEMSNRRLGGVDGELPEVNQDSTDAAYRDARALHERKLFSRKYIREFQEYYGTNEQGLLVHEGDAAVAVHQMNLMRYAVKLMAATGDTRLFTQMEPFANDVILSDFTTMSAAGRLLQIRSYASRSDIGIWTAIQLTSGARHAAAGSKVGEEARDTVARSISSEEVKQEIQLGMDTAEETDDVASELEKNATEFESEGYRARAIAMLDEQARAWDAELDNTLRRLDELAQVKARLQAKAASKVRPSMQEDIAKFEGDEAALDAEMERLRAKAKDLLGKLTQADQSHESKAQRRKRTGNHPRARKLLSTDAQAKALLERYENRNKRTKRDKPAWRDIFDKQVINPQSEAAFTAAVLREGVKPETAAKLYKLATELHAERSMRFSDKAAQDETRELFVKRMVAAGVDEDVAGQIWDDRNKTPAASGKKKKGVNATAFINSIVRQILKTPLSQQRTKRPTAIDKEGEVDVENIGGVGNPWNPDWVKQTFTNAFVEQGIPEDRAAEMAAKLGNRFDDIMRKAQEKAATKAAKAMKMKEPTIAKIGQAIRSQAIDATNTNPVIAALAEAAGYKALTQADLRELAKLDEVIQQGIPTLVAEATTKISRILAKSLPNKKLSRIVEQLFINGALSSLGVMQLNWFHPSYTLPRMLATDLAGLLRDAMFTPGRGSRAANIALMGDLFTSLWQARRGMLSDAWFSLKNDAYQTRMLEHLSIEHSLYRELMEQVEILKTGSAAKKGLAATKLLWLSSDWVRRMLSTADQTWGGVIQQYVLRNEAMRHMIQNLGMTVEAAHGVLELSIEQGKEAEQAHFDATKDKARAALVGRDIMRESLRRGISALSGNDQAGDDLMATMGQTALLELGNRRGEDSPWWDFPNFLLESFKAAASAVRNRMDAMNVPLGRAFTGFISVASNILNRSMYFTPLGFARVWAKTHGSEAKKKKIYTETMATAAMVRARLNEAIVSSIALAILAILRYRDDEDDDYVVVTGAGPENNQQREAWLKQGHKPGMIEFRDGKGNVIVALPYTRGGFDHLAPALTAMGALDDMDLDGHRPRPKDWNWGWAYVQTMGGNQIKQAQFFGIRELVGAVPSSDKPHALSGLVGYTVNAWTPWGGLTKSTIKIFTGAQEQGSVTSAFLSNVPIAQIITGEVVGPRLNFLGDQIGGQPDDMLKKMAERASYAGFPIYIALNPDNPDKDIYDFIVRKGVAPSIPLRSEMESKNGFLTDEEWANYVKTRGALLKAAIRRQMTRIEKAIPADAQSMMETISRDATRQAKAKLKLD